MSDIGGGTETLRGFPSLLSIDPLQAILGYTTKPGLVGSIKSSILHYGSRVALGENQ